MKLKYWVVGDENHGYRIFERTFFGKKYLSKKSPYTHSTYIPLFPKRYEAADEIYIIISKIKFEVESNKRHKRYEQERKREEKENNKFWRNALKEK